MTLAVWSPETCAVWLFDRRARLLREMPAVIEITRGLNDEQREDVFTEAVVTVAAYADDPKRQAIASSTELLRVFWSCCRRHALHQLDGRHNTVRGRFARADDRELHALEDDSSPEEIVVAAEDAQLVAEFAATLDGDVALAFAAKYGGGQVLGERQLARRLDVPRARARQLERSIKTRLEAFSTLVLGRELCDARERQLVASAAGHASGGTRRIVEAHVAHCPACKRRLVALTREIRGPEFGRKVAGLLPVSSSADGEHRRRLREWLFDFAGRHGDTAVTASQLSGSGLGRIGGQLGACIAGGIATVAVCTTTAVVSLGGSPDRAPVEPARPTPTPAPTISGPIATRTPDPIVTATPAPNRSDSSTRRASTRSPGSGAGAGTTKRQGKTAHEESMPAQPASPGSQPNGASEFGPSTVTQAAPPAPADTSSGAAEFGP